MGVSVQAGCCLGWTSFNNGVWAIFQQSRLNKIDCAAGFWASYFTHALLPPHPFGNFLPRPTHTCYPSPQPEVCDVLDEVMTVDFSIVYVYDPLLYTSMIVVRRIVVVNLPERSPRHLLPSQGFSGICICRRSRSQPMALVSSISPRRTTNDISPEEMK